jgi:hypothetical protein
MCVLLIYFLDHQHIQEYKLHSVCIMPGNKILSMLSPHTHTHTHYGNTTIHVCTWVLKSLFWLQTLTSIGPLDILSIDLNLVDAQNEWIF